jgi:hypothetical protein
MGRTSNNITMVVVDIAHDVVEVAGSMKNQQSGEEDEQYLALTPRRSAKFL